MAQLYYPRMIAASNGYGRIRIDYRQIVASAFPRWTDEMLPKDEEILRYFKEYAHNRLIFLYTSAGQLWGQWDAKQGTFGKYQTVADKRSPSPPEEEFKTWLEQNRSHSNKTSVAMTHFELSIPAEILPQGSGKLREGLGEVGDGVGVGEGIGKRVTCKVKRRSPQKPAEVLPMDSWHSRIKSMIQNAWSEQNGGVECPWGAADGAQLKAVRDRSPGWVDGQYAQCLANLYASIGFPRSKLPFEFLPRLCSFLSGPRNEFNQEKVNGAGTSKGDRKAADISKTTREVFGGSGVVHGNDPACLQVKAASAGVGTVAGHSQGLLVSGVQSGNDPPDK
jgi:hypothetical protein